MKTRYGYFLLLMTAMSLGSCSEKKLLELEVYETSAQGNQLSRVEPAPGAGDAIAVQLFPEQKFQEITGFGGSFTEASASLLNRLGPANRRKVLEAYFGPEGARYSLTRTHMNSCDFSLGQYSYAPVAGDTLLEHFSVDEDRDDLIPMIREAMEISEDGFKIVASPWTAPPWMKDNNDWRGG
jgi:glucosylceramidase